MYCCVALYTSWRGRTLSAKSKGQNPHLLHATQIAAIGNI